MDTLYFIGVGFLCAALLVGGAIWTALSYENADEFTPLRLGAPLLLFGAALICYGIFGVFTLFDDKFRFGEPGFWPIFLSIGALGLIFFFKNLIAPFFLSIALAWSTYQFAMYGIWDLVPIYTTIVEGLLFWAPGWVQLTYIWGTLAYFLVGSLIATAS